MIEDVGYLDRSIASRSIRGPSTRSALLNRAGLPVVVVTNQSGIARGFFTEALVDGDASRVSPRASRAGGARVDAYYYCPHHPDGTVAAYARRATAASRDRGMINRAARDLGLDAARSFVVGDTWLDIGLARAVGARGILVRTGSGAA